MRETADPKSLALCEYCFGSGKYHTIGCPNAPEPKKIHDCKTCDYGICEGERYIDIGNGYICENCADELTVTEIMDNLGWRFETAECEVEL